MTSGTTFIEPALVNELDTEAAAHAPASPFAAVGGAKAVVAVVEEFYLRLLRDPRTAPYFAPLIDSAGLAALKRHQVLMLAQALGGPARYAGRDLGVAHAGLDITDEAYRRVCLHLLATLHDFRVPMDILMAVDQLLHSLHDRIVDGPAGTRTPAAGATAR